MPNWHIAAYAIVGVESLIGISFLLGYLVRPFALLGVLLNLNLLWIMGPDQALLYQTLLAIHFTLAWLGAGRCLGIDYYFYKKRRGIWW